MSVVKLNVGCGRKLLEGYINIDILSENEVGPIPGHIEYRQFDVSKGLPYLEDSVDEIITSHVLEHFYPEVIYELLWDFHRVLKRNVGVLKIWVPNFEWWMEKFDRVRCDYLSAVDMMYAILCNVRSYEMGGHKSLLWFDFLWNLMKRIGFELVEFDKETPSLYICGRKRDLSAVDSSSFSVEEIS